MTTKLPPRKVEPTISDREKELEAIVRKLMPALRDIAWCHLVWNDHNFSEADLLRHAKRAGEAMGFRRGDGVEAFNEFWTHVEQVLGPEDTPGSRT
jgi:hypothetical protein